ncbi:AT-rich interactive domain-containing protein 5-like [Triticum dicoccoides]|uniref:AT-rich interactive domain-containing protein 5-like n=1 Tax=Triticum dicoccoides TaxID=85692 RepID=UPI001890F6D7|nr:AT-rich interactive domain-containing protein 5-like [Triticum dicoccoides]
MNDQNHLQTAPVRKHGEESSLLKISSHSLMFDNAHSDEDSGTKEEQDNFMNELEIFHKDNSMQFRPPKFYGEGLNYLKLWIRVNKLGGFDQVTLSRKWHQVGQSFKPPKTCTTVSWSFRNFYEKVLLRFCSAFYISLVVVFLCFIPAMVADLMVSLKGKTMSTIEDGKDLQDGVDNIQIVDMGSRADWVKINVLITKCEFQVYALVPGLLHEELKVLSDPIGRLIINGDPRQLGNSWGVTRFQKVIHLPSRIDPNKTVANLGQYGQLYVCGAFEKSSS